jgi:hypothetical protein
MSEYDVESHSDYEHMPQERMNANFGHFAIRHGTTMS